MKHINNFSDYDDAKEYAKRWLGDSNKNINITQSSDLTWYVSVEDKRNGKTKDAPSSRRKT